MKHDFLNFVIGCNISVVLKKVAIMHEDNLKKDQNFHPCNLKNDTSLEVHLTFKC